MSGKIAISVVVPIVERYDDLEKLFTLYAEALRKLNKTFEFLFVVDGNFPRAFTELEELKKKYAEIKVIKFSRSFFESICLMVGFQHAQGEVVLTLASYIQVEPDALKEILEELDAGQDLVITRRFPRRDSIINRIQSAMFHFILRSFTGFKFQDISCGLRGIKREVALALDLSGDLHRFIPILAFQKGYKVKEINVAQRQEDRQIRLFGFGTYLRRVLDIISLFFLIKFTRKPLRFFGLVGANLFALGLLITGYLGILRLFANEGIAGKPLLLLGLVFIVTGIQVASLGLIGELIIFSHARDIKEYHIETILE